MSDELEWYEPMDDAELAAYLAERATVAAARDRGEQTQARPEDHHLIYLRVHANELKKSEGLHIRFAKNPNWYGHVFLEYKMLPDGETGRVNQNVQHIDHYLSALVTGIRMARGEPIFKPTNRDEIARIM